MRLTLQSQTLGDVVVIRCQGRLVAGVEVDALEAEFDKQTRTSGTKVLLVKKVVLHLGGTDFIDSSGLGALVRLFGVLRAADGDLKLCELSPFVLNVLRMTNLLGIFQTYPSEQEAIETFKRGARSGQAQGGISGTGILCIDPSSDLLAYLNALLKRSGYSVFTTRYPGEVPTLVTAARPRVVICGPGVPAMPIGAEMLAKLRRSSPGIGILQLPSDFSTTEAGQAGVDLVSSVQAMLAA